jgi:hypothetical protein
MEQRYSSEGPGDPAGTGWNNVQTHVTQRRTADSPRHGLIFHISGIGVRLFLSLREAFTTSSHEQIGEEHVALSG